MKCPKCQHENRQGASFCGKCGTELLLICPRCASENTPGNNFCDKCGHNLTLPVEPVPKDLSFDEKIAKIQRYLPEGLTDKILSQRERIEGERKQVTVMFCDMEGFTGLTERLGPEEAYSIMDQVYEILIHKVHDYEGTVNEMTGDGIMALFGAPIAIEDAPQRAIRSAMAIHREMTKFSERMSKEKSGMPSLKMRVGIHSGPVVVGSLGNDLRVEFKAVGDTVNLASRMEELSRPGTTYVTEETFKLTEGLFRFEALGEKEIKGKEEAVTFYQVIAPSTRRTRFDVSAERGLTPFVGRDRELELLLDGFERAKAGRGQSFSVVAEAGIGKSRLLYEFQKAVSSEDITFLEGRCLSYSRGIAYHPVIDALKSNFDVQEDDSNLHVTEKVKKGLKVIGADEVSTLPYLLDLLSVEDSGIDRTSISPEAKRDRVVEAVKRIVLRGSELRPLVMAFEDLHWADKTSEEVLKSLVEAIAGAKILLIFTHRPEFVHTWGGKSYHSQVNLNRLSNRESLAMVTHLLGTEDIETDLEELILDKTEGVPFFIEEFTKSLKDLEIIERKKNRYHLTKGVKEVSIPSTVQDVIMARIDSLPEAAKEVLQTGAVIDREFSYELIKRVAGLPEQELLSRLSGLRDSELIYERGIYPQSTYIFKHALTQEVAYNGLLVKSQKEIHEKIGKALEELQSERLEDHCEVLAYHYMRSENKEKAVEYLCMSHFKAIKATAIEGAKTYFDECMNLLDTMPDTKENREHRISLLVNSFTVFNLLLQMSEYNELLTRYEPLVAGIDNAGLAGGFYASLGWCEQLFGSFDRSIQSAKRGAELCEQTGDVEGVGIALSCLQISHFYRGAYEQGIALKEEILAKLDERATLRRTVSPLGFASLCYLVLGRWDEALKEARKALSLAKEHSNDSLISFASYCICMIYTGKGELDQAIEYGEMAVERASTPADNVLSLTSLAWARCRAGELEKSIEYLSEAVEAMATGQVVTTQISFMPALAEGYLLAGNYDGARQTAEKVLELAEPCEAKFYIGCAHLLLAEVALNTSLDEAPSHFEKAISIFQEIKAENDLALTYSGMGRYYKHQGDTGQAREYLTRALEIFERLGTLIEPDKVREELASLS